MSGSIIGLVNAAQVDSGPTTTYTYNPSGTPTVSGASNFWPFQYDGTGAPVMEIPKKIGEGKCLYDFYQACK